MHPDVALASGEVPGLEGWNIGSSEVGRLASDSGRFYINDVLEKSDPGEYRSFGLAADVQLDVLVVEGRDEFGNGEQFIGLGAVVGDWRRPGEWRLLASPVPHPRGTNDLMILGRSGTLAIFPDEKKDWFSDLDTDPDYVSHIWSVLGDKMAKVVDGVAYIWSESGSYPCWGKFAPVGDMVAIYVDLDMFTDDEE
ncbi:hypothetical protein [Nocardioides sp. YR527]|uniref:hypothetical protein n=1 Tax=Nocardioides sp. YR527 TaxID=1881028 RepID=UPI00115FC39D|nr:hypothetical protein [Nocardioides sp. YR527]